jgi:hypothetical protein
LEEQNILITIGGTARVGVVEFSALLFLLPSEGFLVLKKLLLLLLPYQNLQELEDVNPPSFSVLHTITIRDKMSKFVNVHVIRYVPNKSNSLGIFNGTRHSLKCYIQHRVKNKEKLLT